MAKAIQLIALLFLITTASAHATPARWVNGRLGKADLKIEIVESMEERSLGLMNRKLLPTNQAMLFIFEQEQGLSFWMKNTLIPLSIGFFDHDLKLIDMQDMNPEPPMVSELAHYTSKQPAQFALEVNQGWFKKHGIQLGDHLKILQAPPSPQLERFFKATGPKSTSPKSGD